MARLQAPDWGPRAKEPLMDQVSLFDHYQLMGREGIIFVFKGSMSQALLVKFCDMIREDLFLESKELAEIRTLFAVFIELAQNVTRYSAERASEGLDKGAGIGVIVVSQSADRYTVASGNLVENARLALMTERLQAMKDQPADVLRTMYRTQMKQGPPEGSVGAGLGLIDMARRSGGGLRYCVSPVDQEKSFIEFIVDIRKETEDGQA